MIGRLRELGRNIGPGAMVTAAFIGPGTVTTSTLAGANFGYTLLWALVFATFATIILQEMSARLGIVTQQGLGDALAGLFGDSAWRWPLILLVGAALYMGNAAYEGGNLAGAALGIAAIAGEGEWTFRGSIMAISVLAAVLLTTGSYRHIERALVALVVLMAFAFVATFAMVGPDLAAMLNGMLVPSIPDGAIMTIVALIGTTVVPYNLFLHASAVHNRFNRAAELPVARADTIVTIGIGGIIAMLIVATASASMFAAGIAVTSAADMATQFEPLFGSNAKYLMGLGLFAAGLTSAITAPLATGYAMSEILGVAEDTKPKVLRAVALSVIVIGAALSLTGTRPVTIILSAQFANGILLPVIAGFLLYAMNQERLLGAYVNKIYANIAGMAVVVVAAGLGIRSVVSALGMI